MSLGERLRRTWDALEAAGAKVRRFPLHELERWEVALLLTDERRRLRALGERH